MTASALPESLAGISEAFGELELPERLQLLAEFAAGLPPLPAVYAESPELLERVAECQSPVFIVVDVGLDGRVALHATAPEQAPTTRGFAGVLVEGVAGLTPAELDAVPDEFARELGLERVVSPLRLAGMAGMLRRVKRQAREKGAA
ncbi:SufE family protein [Microbacterium thalassium]|uniref:Cysteine desulfuration protein SufE n=1 Tax=Microbacterium thalassium TaxID=362649 RepID=A0A7X0FRT7_9MICO|nr:SufE family protein [Microbacterium thalassium]MBB6391927.1 cysteine desulfuration protein SufE [Microbacterium thalassium]GLK23947.1 cysteine desulfurization protein SufE [Microbacterium thalassium]